MNKDSSQAPSFQAKKKHPCLDDNIIGSEAKGRGQGSTTWMSNVWRRTVIVGGLGFSGSSVGNREDVAGIPVS